VESSGERFVGSLTGVVVALTVTCGGEANVALPGATAPAELRGNSMTGARRPPSWPARVALAGSALVAALIVLSLALHPANLRAPGANADMAIAAVLLAVYLTLGCGRYAGRPR